MNNSQACWDCWSWGQFTLVLKAFLLTIKGRLVQVLTDNTTATSLWNKLGRVRSWPLCHLRLRLWNWLDCQVNSLVANQMAGSLKTRAADNNQSMNDSCTWRWHRSCSNNRESSDWIFSPVRRMHSISTFTYCSFQSSTPSETPFVWSGSQDSRMPSRHFLTCPKFWRRSQWQQTGPQVCGTWNSRAWAAVLLTSGCFGKICCSSRAGCFIRACTLCVSMLRDWAATAELVQPAFEVVGGKASLHYITAR